MVALLAWTVGPWTPVALCALDSGFTAVVKTAAMPDCHAKAAAASKSGHDHCCDDVSDSCCLSALDVTGTLSAVSTLTAPAVAIATSPVLALACAPARSRPNALPARPPDSGGLHASSVLRL